jgi:hypothetical protein
MVFVELMTSERTGHGSAETRTGVWWWCGSLPGSDCAFSGHEEQGPAALVLTPAGCPECRAVSVAVEPGTRAWSCAVAASDGSIIVTIDGFVTERDAWSRARAFVRAYLRALRLEA